MDSLDEIQVEKLIKDIVNTRNYRTHFDKSLRNHIIGEDKLIYVNKVLELFLYMILTKHLKIINNFNYTWFHNSEYIKKLKRDLKKIIN